MQQPPVRGQNTKTNDLKGRKEKAIHQSHAEKKGKHYAI